MKNELVNKAEVLKILYFEKNNKNKIERVKALPSICPIVIKEKRSLFCKKNDEPDIPFSNCPNPNCNAHWKVAGMEYCPSCGTKF